MSETILVRARRQLGARLTRGTVVDVIDLVSDVRAVLAEVAGLLFGSGGSDPDPGTAVNVSALATHAPMPSPASPRIAGTTEREDLRLGRRARRGSNSRAGRRLAAHLLRCHPSGAPGSDPRRRRRHEPAPRAHGTAAVKKFRA
jgi:hypothetical protein